MSSLRPEHLEDAARLFAARYRAERRRFPVFPARHEADDGIVPMLARLLDRAPGAAAIERGRLVGYLVGLPIPQFKGLQRGALSPIWAHAAVGEDRAEVYRRLYERISGQWVEAGCLTHAITLYAGDAEVQDVWFRNCFGLLVVDALRALDPVPAAAPPDVEIRQASPDDADLVLVLARELERYLAGGPIFLPLMESADRAEHAEWLAEPRHALWLALRGGEPVGYVRCQPPGHDVAYVVSDPATTAITGAYVRPRWRRGGVAASLLGHIVEWARANGYERISVDFESQNLNASRFWPRYFRPVCHSLIRKVDERIAWAHADRPLESIW